MLPFLQQVESFISSKASVQERVWNWKSLALLTRSSLKIRCFYMLRGESHQYLTQDGSFIERFVVVNEFDTQQVSTFACALLGASFDTPRRSDASAAEYP